MNKNTVICAVLACVSVVMIAGCQSQPVPADVTEQETDIPELAVPYSRGPTSPPSVKGPTSAPPGGTDAEVAPAVNDEQPQAVTETEDITITLPTGLPSGAPTSPPGTPVESEDAAAEISG